MKADIKSLLSEMRAGLEKIYGEHLKNVYLYGSYARGEQDEESDVDVLIVLDRIDSYWHEIERTGFLASGISLKYDVTVSRAFISHQDWVRRDTPFLSNVREEAIPA